MASDKLNKLVRYVDDLKNKLTSPPSAKHASDQASYHEFLRREIASHTVKIESLRMAEPAKK